MELITRSLPNVEPSLHSWGIKHTGSWCIFLLIHCRVHPTLHLECLLSYSHPSLLLALFPDRPLGLSLTPRRRGHRLYLCAEHQAVFAATHLTSPTRRHLRGTVPLLPTQHRPRPGCRLETQDSSLAPPSGSPIEFTPKYSCLLPPAFLVQPPPFHTASAQPSPTPSGPPAPASSHLCRLQTWPGWSPFSGSQNKDNIQGVAWGPALPATQLQFHLSTHTPRPGCASSCPGLFQVGQLPTTLRLPGLINSCGETSLQQLPRSGDPLNDV